MSKGRGKTPRKKATPTTPPPVPAPEPVSARAQLLYALGIFVALLVLYAATLAPTVVGGDSGELLSSALTGGVPHPPGYPLFALLARLFAALPVGGSPAMRVNLLSAVTTAGAGALVALFTWRHTGKAFAGLVTAAFFGGNAGIWLHAVSTEVFGLNLLFVAVALLLWSSIERAPRVVPVIALAFVSGLAMCNHHTFVFVGAPLVLRSFWVARHALRARGIGAAVVAGLVGLLPYGYLALASRSSAAVSWGDETTWSGFLDHVLRRNYGTFSLGREGGAFVDGGTFWPTLFLQIGHAFRRFAWVGMPLGLYGLYQAIRKRDRVGIVVAVVLAVYALTFTGLSNIDTSKGLYRYVLSRFFLQSDLLFSLFMGLGAAALLDGLAPRLPALARHPRWRYALGPVVLALCIGLHLGYANQRHNTVFRDFTKAAFDSLPPRTILISMGDHVTGAVFYFHEVEKWRPDIIHLDRELLGFPWYCARKKKLHPDLFLPDGTYGPQGWPIKKLLEGNPGRPLVVIDRLEAWDQSWKDGYKLASNGLVHPLVPAAQFPDFHAWRAKDVAAMGAYSLRSALKHRNESWGYALGETTLAAQSGRAHLALVYASANQNSPVMAHVARELLEQIVTLAGGDPDLGIPGDPELPVLAIGPSVYKDLGIAYEMIALVDGAFRPKVGIAFDKFVQRAKPDDADLPKARAYLQNQRAGK